MIITKENDKISPIHSVFDTCTYLYYLTKNIYKHNRSKIYIHKILIDYHSYLCWYEFAHAHFLPNYLGGVLVSLYVK